jgi:hypothetical protein
LGQDLVEGLVKEMKLFAGLEANCFAWSNGDFRARSWVASDAGLARLYRKDAESAKFDAITCYESLLHALEDGINSRFRFRPWQAGTLNHPLYKILLNHLAAVLGL